MQCHASHQTAEIMKIMGLLVVHVPSRWRPDHGRDGGRCRGPRTHPVAEKRSKQQRFSPSEVLLGVLGCSSMPSRRPRRPRMSVIAPTGARTWLHSPPTTYSPPAARSPGASWTSLWPRGGCKWPEMPILSIWADGGCSHLRNFAAATPSRQCGAARYVNDAPHVKNRVCAASRGLPCRSAAASQSPRAS